MPSNPLRNLPSVHELLERPVIKSLLNRISRSTAISTIGAVLDEVRREVQTAAADHAMPSVGDLAERIVERIATKQTASPQPVINATGMILRDDLGRAPLADEAVAEIAAVAGGSMNLELDLTTGMPKKREAETEQLLCELTGAEASCFANNNAAALVLTLAALAEGREVVVSRGDLLDVGDYCRLPDLIAASKASLREVGAANHTRIDDYAQAVNERTAAILLVHHGGCLPPNASTNASLQEIVQLGQHEKIPVLHDIGWGALVDLEPRGIPEAPLVSQSIRHGADLVLFSGDKLLGGPQAGIIAGKKPLIDKIATHPFRRILRPGKLTLAALHSTLALYRNPETAGFRIPVLSLLTTSAANLHNRAARLAAQAEAMPAVEIADVVADAAPREGNPRFMENMPTWCISLKPAAMSVDRFTAALRTGTPAVIGRLRDDRLLLDLRTVLPRQDLQLLAALEAIPALPHDPGHD